MISWNLGCRRTSPIVLHLPEGDLPTGSEAIDFCGFTCEQIYARGMPGFCTDCGPGYSDRVAPGGSALIDWDRRVYTSHTLDPACRPPSPPQEWPCALGHAVTPSPAQSGTITICPGTVPNPNPGACQDASGNPVALRPVEFTVDTTGTEAVIEVR
jgi:hypothetical protein